MGVETRMGKYGGRRFGSRGRDLQRFLLRKGELVWDAKNKCFFMAWNRDTYDEMKWQ